MNIYEREKDKLQLANRSVYSMKYSVYPYIPYLYNIYRNTAYTVHVACVFLCATQFFIFLDLLYNMLFFQTHLPKIQVNISR